MASDWVMVFVTLVLVGVTAAHMYEARAQRQQQLTPYLRIQEPRAAVLIGTRVQLQLEFALWNAGLGPAVLVDTSVTTDTGENLKPFHLFFPSVLAPEISPPVVRYWSNSDMPEDWDQYTSRDRTFTVRLVYDSVLEGNRYETCVRFLAALGAAPPSIVPDTLVWPSSVRLFSEIAGELVPGSVVDAQWLEPDQRSASARRVRPAISQPNTFANFIAAALLLYLAIGAISIPYPDLGAALFVTVSVLLLALALALWRRAVNSRDRLTRRARHRSS